MIIELVFYHQSPQNPFGSDIVVPPATECEHVTFNHGVEGSSPSALTKLGPFYKGLLKTSPQSPSRKTHLARVWGGSGGNPLSADSETLQWESWGELAFSAPRPCPAIARLPWRHRHRANAPGTDWRSRVWQDRP
jgi:hypothetical protein